MAMSQKEYIEKKGVKCPFCGGGDIEGHKVEIDGGGAHQEVTCLDCKPTDPNGRMFHPSPSGLGRGITLSLSTPS